LAQRRHLAHAARHAVAAALAKRPGFAATPGRPDFGPWISGMDPLPGQFATFW